jgi:hypothetical protein
MTSQDKALAGSQQHWFAPSLSFYRWENWGQKTKATALRHKDSNLAGYKTEVAEALATDLKSEAFLATERFSLFAYLFKL